MLATCVWYIVPVVGLIVGVLFADEWNGYSAIEITVQILGCVIIWIGLFLTMSPKFYDWLQSRKQPPTIATTPLSSFKPTDDMKEPLLGKI